MGYNSSYKPGFTHQIERANICRKSFIILDREKPVLFRTLEAVVVLVYTMLNLGKFMLKVVDRKFSYYANFREFHCIVIIQLGCLSHES